MIVIRSTAAAKDSMSARIIRAVEEAEQKKAPLQRLHKFAARYTPTVFVIAVAVAIVGPLVTNFPGPSDLPGARASCHCLPVRFGDFDRP